MPGQRGTIEQRFWRKVEKTDRCWGWKGSKDRRGYGRLSTARGRAPAKAHRVSWQIHFGAIPDGLFVLHDCDNPPCTRPDHLFLGTHQINMEDATRKGRMKVPGKAHYGPDNKSSKLNAIKAAQIRQLSKAGKTDTSLAARFKVSRRTIANIRNNKTWKVAGHGEC